MTNLYIKIRAHFSPNVICTLILLIIFSIALFLRVYFPYEDVFVGDWVKFKKFDSWYHIRLVENLVHHFPYRISFDPYTLYPTGQNVVFAPFFDILLGFIIWTIGLGNPAPQTIETVSAYFPAILGALITVPVYFIGKELFNRNVGLLSAALIAILPGQFLMRSLLGFTDHHVAEVFFSTITILSLILALKSARKNEIAFSHIRSGYWKNIKISLLYPLLTGLFLGIYILSWIGGLFLVFIIFIYIAIQYIIDHLGGNSTDYLCIIGLPSFSIALIMIVPFLHQGALGGTIHLISLAIGALTFLVLSSVSRLMLTKNIKPAYYPLALAGLALVGLLAFYMIAPSLLSSILGKFNIFMPKGSALTIQEVQPLLFPHGVFSLQRAWRYFNTSFFIAIISFGFIIYSAAKKKNHEKILFLVWSVVMLFATLGQNRFAYYFAVNVALLNGYLCWKVLECILKILKRNDFRGPFLANKKAKLERKVERRKKLKGDKRQDRERRESRSFVTQYFGLRYIVIPTVIIIIFFGIFYPNIREAISLAKLPSDPNKDWYNSLVWMRENTPDPFQNPDFYYELYEKPPAGEGYNYPESAYGVMSWWDYGHWITRIAHRIPNSNPHQAGADRAARFFTSQDECSANKMLDKWGSKYVIIDHNMATTGFYAMAIFAGKSQSQFLEIYYERMANGKLKPIILCYPEYYRSMCSRLYNFGGKAVVPVNSTWVISYIERIGAKGNRYKEISDHKLFSTYKEAKAFLKTHPNYKIVGIYPFISPVPLRKLEHYKLIYQSDSTVIKRGDETISYVEIFEYIP